MLSLFLDAPVKTNSYPAAYAAITSTREYSNELASAISLSLVYS